MPFEELKKLFLRRSSDRAILGAGAAADALVRIDNVLLTLGDSVHRAARCASAARNALITDLVCHNQYTSLKFGFDYITYGRILQ